MDHYIPSCRVFAPRTCHERGSTDLTPRDATAATLSNRMEHPPAVAARIDAHPIPRPSGRIDSMEECRGRVPGRRPRNYGYLL